MERYRVLLADDEEDIRVGISRKMPWKELGFELVGEAENGQDALELAESLQPDVVLTDIKMPFMDGLELCRVLTKRLPAAKFVVFSGFDDFEYAKQAIQMNVSEYILKPINASELSAVLSKLKEQLDTERTERQNLETLRRRYEESLPILRNLFLSRLLDGRVEHPEELAAQYDVDLSGTLLAALVHIHASQERRELLAVSVQQLFAENLSLPDGECRCFLYRDGVAVLAAWHGSGTVYDFIDAAGRVCALAESYLGIKLTVGVGLPCLSSEELPQSAAGARSALEYRSLVGRGGTIYIGDLEPETGGRVPFDENSERELTSSIKLCGEDEVRQTVHRLVARFRVAELSVTQYHLFFLELTTCLLKLTRSAGLNLEEVFGSEFMEKLQGAEFDSAEALEDWCVQRCLRIQELLRRQRTDSTGQLVEKAKQFIASHYGESDLSVEMLCDYLHLSPAYFSTVFKREVGMNFTAYVTVVRMDAAASALRNTEEKTYLVARQCGYDDPNYFSYVFKRHFGMTPTKYRAGGQ